MSSERVQKFRSVEAMDAAPVLVPPGEAFDRFIRHCARLRRLHPRTFPRGVFKYRSIEEAQAVRERLARES
jgi:hypothetical protein